MGLILFFYLSIIINRVVLLVNSSMVYGVNYDPVSRLDLILILLDFDNLFYICFLHLEIIFFFVNCTSGHQPSHDRVKWGGPKKEIVSLSIKKKEIVCSFIGSRE